MLKCYVTCTTVHSVAFQKKIYCSINSTCWGETQHADRAQKPHVALADVTSAPPVTAEHKEIWKTNQRAKQLFVNCVFQVKTAEGTGRNLPLEKNMSQDRFQVVLQTAFMSLCAENIDMPTKREKKKGTTSEPVLFF